MDRHVLLVAIVMVMPTLGTLASAAGPEGLVVVNPNGDANCSPDTTTGDCTAVSGTGNATAKCEFYDCVAVSPTGAASGGTALSATGNSTGSTAISATGNSSAVDYAISGTGNANGDLLAISGSGNATSTNAAASGMGDAIANGHTISQKTLTSYAGHPPPAAAPWGEWIPSHFPITNGSSPELLGLGIPQTDTCPDAGDPSLAPAGGDAVLVSLDIYCGSGNVWTKIGMVYRHDSYGWHALLASKDYAPPPMFQSIFVDPSGKIHLFWVSSNFTDPLDQLAFYGHNTSATNWTFEQIRSGSQQAFWIEGGMGVGPHGEVGFVAGLALQTYSDLDTVNYFSRAPNGTWSVERVLACCSFNNKNSVVFRSDGRPVITDETYEQGFWATNVEEKTPDGTWSHHRFPGCWESVIQMGHDDWPRIACRAGLGGRTDWEYGVESASGWDIHTAPSYIPQSRGGFLGVEDFALDSHDIPHVVLFTFFTPSQRSGPIYATRTPIGWDYETVQTPEDLPNEETYGFFTAIAVDSNDVPHVMYNDVSALGREQVLATPLAGIRPNGNPDDIAQAVTDSETGSATWTVTEISDAQATVSATSGTTPGVPTGVVIGSDNDRDHIPQYVGITMETVTVQGNGSVTWSQSEKDTGVDPNDQDPTNPVPRTMLSPCAGPGTECIFLQSGIPPGGASALVILYPSNVGNRPPILWFGGYIQAGSTSFVL